MIAVLQEELCTLANRLGEHGIKLIIGGGFGILLRSIHLEGTNAPTLRPITPPRATNDLDLFLTADIITDVDSVQRIRSVLDELGYEPVPTAKNYQFARPVTVLGRSGVLKIDLLAQEPRTAAEEGKAKMDSRRIRPRGTFTGLHAHILPEAFSLDEQLLSVSVCPAEGVTVDIPHPFTMIALKTFALRDQQNNSLRDFGRHHAFDIYVLLRMLTREDWASFPGIMEKYRGHERMAELRCELENLFADVTAVGAIRLLEHARASDISMEDYPIEAFLADLSELMGMDESNSGG